MNQKDKKLPWHVATFMLIPLCFIVDYIVDMAGNDDGGWIVFVLIIFSYSLFFFLRRNATPTILSVVSFYIISILGAGFILLTSGGWVVLVIFALNLSLAKTMIVTKAGKEVYLQLENEEKEQKGIKKLIATPTEQKENLKWIIDAAIFIVTGVVFLLCRGC